MGMIADQLKANLAEMKARDAELESMVTELLADVRQAIEQIDAIDEMTGDWLEDGVTVNS